MNHLEDSKSRKQIAFDLVQDDLKEHYPKPQTSSNPQHHNKAYRDLQKFFIGENWEHRQGSVYTSVKTLSHFEVINLIDRAANEMSWLSKCVDEIDVTDISEQYSLKQDLEIATQVVAAEEPAIPIP